MQRNDLLLTGCVVLPDRVVSDGAVFARDGRIDCVGAAADVIPETPANTARIDAGAGYIVPGYVDLHVHGGAGADFMDGTAEAFQTVVGAHLRHGTTSIVPTTTVARQDQLIAVLEHCRNWRRDRRAGDARVLGAHLYGPYFNYDARGCHPGDHIRPPVASEFERYLEYSDALTTATVAPELSGAEAFVRACDRRGVRTNVGHSQATFAQMSDAVAWGVRHVDHLYCAMSDKTKLRQRQAYPMQGGVLEATLYFDELTTEIIADGKHLSTDLMLLALKIKGPDRLALVTDCNRALDMPDGQYQFGPLEGGEPFVRRDNVGVMPDGQALASGVSGMDHMVRTFATMTGRPLWETIQMATLTPARIAGHDRNIGSIQAGKRADLLILDAELNVQRVFIDAIEITTAN